MAVRSIDTDADGLEALVKAPHLEELFLEPVALDERSLAAIAALKELKKLGLHSGGIVTDAALAKLARVQQITELSLDGSGMNDDGLRQLANLHALEILSLPDSMITGAGMAALTKLKQLKNLYLSNSPFNDEGGEALRGLPALEWLDLRKRKSPTARSRRSEHWRACAR